MLVPAVPLTFCLREIPNCRTLAASGKGPSGLPGALSWDTMASSHLCTSRVTCLPQQ